jgi:hypothetical protein
VTKTVTKTMRRIALILSLCTVLFSVAARANNLVLTNGSGSVMIAKTGILSGELELTGYIFDGKAAPPGYHLGSVSFSTGALATGSILVGGTFSSANSSFTVTGSGKYGVPKGTIFSGSFIEPINWTLVGRAGNQLVYDLSGNLSGVLFTGRTIAGSTTQTIYVSQNLQGRIHVGESGIGFCDCGLTPEPETLLLFGTGLTVIVGAMRNRLLGT